LQRLAKQTSLACEIVQGIIKESKLRFENPGAPTDSNLVQRISAFCRRRLSSGITVDDMVTEAHMSRSAFFARLKESTGMTPAQLLKKIRLERGMTLLRQSEKSTAQIADAVGFADQFHFAREFKKSYGLTPSQYRKTHGLPPDNMASMVDADALFDATRYQRAAQAYAAVREKHAGSDLAMRACYRQGLSLFLGGTPDRAFEVWQATQGTQFEHSVELRRCRYLFDTGRHAEVIDLLGRLCRSEIKAVRDEALGQWSGCVEGLLRQERVAMLHEYLALRSRAFPRDPATGLSAARALFATGRYLDVPDECPDPRRCIPALRSAGRYDEILRRYGNSPYRTQIARTLYNMGEYERILRQYPDVKSICVEALVQLGRPEEAVKKYPDVCGPALLAMKRYEEVLKRCPSDPGYRVTALRGLDRTEEALEECMGDTWLRQLTLLFLGRCGEVLDDKSVETVGLRQTALAIRGMQMLLEDRRDEGLALIESLSWIGSKDFFWDHFDPLLHFLAPLLRSIDGEKDVLESRCREIVDRFRYCFSQRLWHDAAFVVGKIDSEDYLKQPQQPGVEVRLAFACGMRADCQGRRKEALESYRRFFELQQCVWEDPLHMHFFRWRSGCR
jgi:AraC-like DNA-binding protein